VWLVCKSSGVTGTCGMASGCSCALKLSTHQLPCEKIYPSVCRGRSTRCTRKPTPPRPVPTARRATLVGAAVAAATVTLPAAPPRPRLFAIIAAAMESAFNAA